MGTAGPSGGEQGDKRSAEDARGDSARRASGRYVAPWRGYVRMPAPRCYTMTGSVRGSQAGIGCGVGLASACWLASSEVSFGEITDLIGLARHGAHSFSGLLTRTAATIAAHTLMRVCLAVA